MDEPTLLRKLQARDEAAFNRLVREHQAQVFRLSLRMLGDSAEAEEITQEVFVTVFKSIDRFRGDSKLSTWLYRIAINHCRNRIKYLNRRARGATQEFDDFSDRETSASGTNSRLPRPDELAEGHELESRLRVAMARLPGDQRELLVLRDVEGLSYDDIQSITRLAAGTVKSRLHRARLALIAAIASENERE